MKEKFTWGFLPSERVEITAVRVRIVMALRQAQLPLISFVCSICVLN